MPRPERQSLLVGATGQIGSALLRLLGPEQSLVTSRQPARDSELQLDLARLTRREQVETVLADRPLDCIYCIGGMTHVDGCEDQPEVAFATNTTGPAVLAELANERNIPFVYFSTDYVFDGQAGPYRETDGTSPICVYGRSKLEGEHAVLAACKRAIVVRTTVVYGEDAGAKNFLYSLIRTLASGRTMRVPNDQISTPTYNRDLALAALLLAKRNETGIFHVCGPQRMNRLQFAHAAASALALDDALLVAVATRDLGQKAPRPLSAGLISDRLDRLLPDLKMQSLSEGLASCRPSLEAYLALIQRQM